MSKFHFLNIVSFFLLLAILAMGFQVTILISLLGILYLGMLVLGSTLIQLNFYFTSFNKGNTEKKQIALTFDDGPDAQLTTQILDILTKHSIKATFFCIGKKAETQGELLKRIDNDGHLIGNHSYSHTKLFSLFTPKKISNELRLTNDIIAKHIEKKPKLFRPPFGVTNPSIGKAIRETKLLSVGWSLRSFDTSRNPEKVLKKIKNRLKPGDVILFHDDRSNTPKILASLLPWLLENQFEVIGLDKLLKIDAYEKN